MKSDPRRPLLALVAALALASCATTGRSLGNDPFSGSEGRPTTIRIEVLNLNFQDARLYALRNGTRVSLGTVGGKQDRSFTIEWDFTQRLSIEINLLAGPTCRTESLFVEPGDIIELQIQSVFSQSAFCR